MDIQIQNRMRWISRTVVLAIIVISIFIIAKPEMFFEFVDSLTSVGLYSVAAFRVVFGLLLIGAAGASRMPRTLQVVGALLIFGGIMIPFIGVDGLHAIFDAIYGQSVALFRAGTTIGVLVQLFFMYALSRRPEELEARLAKAE